MPSTSMNMAEGASFRSGEAAPVAPLSDIIWCNRTPLVSILAPSQALVQPRSSFVREHMLIVHKRKPLSRTLTINPFWRWRYIITDESIFIARISIVIYRRRSNSRRFRQGGV